MTSVSPRPASNSLQGKLKHPKATSAKAASWTFLTLPKAASARLPVARHGVGGRHHQWPALSRHARAGRQEEVYWLKVSRKLREAAGAEAGDVVTLDRSAAEREPEPRMPSDLRKVLAAAPKARSVWKDITPIARRDWIQWIVSARRPETRARRVDNACSMLAGGKRRICCFDRSGFYSKEMSAPEAAT